MSRDSDLEFSLKELSGATGDFGTLLPLAVGFIMINGMNPGSIMIAFGLSNIATGIIYRAPMPLQPMKAIAAIAIAQRWSADLVTATALSMGIFWLLVSMVPRVELLIRKTPTSVVRGIQLALGASLAIAGASMILDGITYLGIAAIGLIILLNRGGRRGPSSIVILAIGIAIALVRGAPVASPWTFSPPAFLLPNASLAWEGLLRGGIAQIPLTLTNAVIACCALISHYFPEKHIPERKLMMNMGYMNIGASLIGGFPMCHGAGGLASQYYFGARTGGANVMEGTLEVLIGLFLGSAMVGIFSEFPEALLGAMMLMVGIELGKFSGGVEKHMWPTVLVTVACALYWNLGVGFAVGIAFHLASGMIKRTM